jgi:outer membrane protein TolC
MSSGNPMPERRMSSRHGRQLQRAFLLGLTLTAGCAADRASVSDQAAYPPAREGGARARPVADPGVRPASLPTANASQTSPSSTGIGRDPSATENASPGTQAPPAASTERSVVDQPRKAVISVDDRSTVPAPFSIPLPFEEYPIDLATALRLADVSNPTIAAARTLVLEALANQLAARVLLVPSLNSGVSYHGHQGLLQRSSGKIISLSQQSLYMGAGAGIVTAGTAELPGVNIFTPLTDAWFEPLAARQRVLGARFHAQATANEILLDVAALYIRLLGNQSILEMQRLSESQVHDVVDITRHYAEIGLGRDSDANRAFSQWKRRRADVLKAEEELAVTAARLANRLNLDPSARLEAAGGPLVELTLVDLGTPQRELLQVALRQRPDIAARTAAIGEAEVRFKQEVGRPLLPTLWLGFSGGAFGGGSNLVPPLVGNFAGRTDFDVRVYWTLLNMGAGNLSLIKERRAQIGQTVAEQSATINLARGEVSASLADAQAAHNQVAVARSELASAELGFKEDLGRSRQNLGRPIEVLNSLTLLAQARVNLIKALVHYDQAQFSLWVSLGSPPPLDVPQVPVRPAVGALGG